MIKFPSINQYRNAIVSLQHMRKHGHLASSKVMYEGTVKLHGTNAGVVYTWLNNTLTFQSRERELTPESDNFGFAAWGTTNSGVLKAIAISIIDAVQPEAMPEGVVIFGEWCGGSIQKGIAISNLPKTFVVFKAALFNKKYTVDNELEVERTWVSSEVLDKCVSTFPHYNSLLSVFSIPGATHKVEIDVSYPQEVQNTLAGITQAVELECPLGKMFGFSGVGEGMVWAPVDASMPSNTWFKVKGEKHSVSKVKTLASVDPELVSSIREFVECVVTENRLQQGYDLITDKPTEKTGEFLKWLSLDIIKEESDTLETNGLKWADVVKPINLKARNWFMAKLNSDL